MCSVDCIGVMLFYKSNCLWWWAASSHSFALQPGKAIPSSWQLSCRMSWQLTPIVFCLCSFYDTFDVVGTLIQKHPEKYRNMKKDLELAKDWNLEFIFTTTFLGASSTGGIEDERHKDAFIHLSSTAWEFW